VAGTRASSPVSRDGRTGGDRRKAYQPPEVRAYGDIRSLTAHGFRHKDWGPGDFFILFHTEGPGPSGGGGGTGLS
jgi:hypothetical protein